MLRGEDPDDAVPLLKRLSAAVPLRDLGPAVQRGQISPVVHARVFCLANSLLVAMVEGYARRYRESSAVVGRAVERALLDEESRATLLLKLDAADAVVEQALIKARRDFEAVGLTEQIDADLSPFDRALRIIDDVILVGAVAVQYRALTRVERVRHETQH